MFAVIFEVEPKRERFDDYLKIAGALRPDLERIDGFILNERFASARRPGRLLSLSIWRDEKAVVRWRTLANHHEAQIAGRTQIFADYHLRVGEIVADSGAPQGALAEERLDETETGAAKAVTISELTRAGEVPGAADLAATLGLVGGGLIEHDAFTGIADARKLVLLAGWQNRAAAAAWRPTPAAEGALRHRVVRIVRDYGLGDRREAPQYYPPVAPP